MSFKTEIPPDFSSSFKYPVKILERESYAVELISSFSSNKKSKEKGMSFLLIGDLAVGKLYHSFFIK